MQVFARRGGTKRMLLAYAALVCCAASGPAVFADLYDPSGGGLPTSGLGDGYAFGGSKIGARMQSHSIERWFLSFDSVTSLDSLLDARTSHGSYAASHRATLVSWGSFFDTAVTPGDIPSPGSGLIGDPPEEPDDPGDQPGVPGGPEIPPIPAPGSLALTGLGAMVVVLARRRMG